MRMPIYTLLVSIITLSVSTNTLADKKVVCYVADWTAWRSGPGKFDIDNVDTNLCTHVIYAFVDLTGDSGITAPARGADGLDKLRNLKNSNPNVNIMVAVGGWSEASTKFSPLASNAASRGQFVQNVINFMNEWNLDGLDIDWEYPTQRDGSTPEDVDNYVALVRDLKEGFSTQQKNYQLSAAVSAGIGTASQAYRINEISQYLDFINLMAYDFHGSWESQTGMHSGLYGNDQLTVDAAVSYWLDQGCPPDKLVVGVPLYGKSWTLADPNNNGVGAPASGAGDPGEFSQAAGSLCYYEICQKISNEGWNLQLDDTSKTPYAFNGNQWVSFDNVQSINEKVQYIKNRQLGGGMVWAIDNDDTTGICGERYPLLTALNEVRR
ncbi:hypothetical protein HCN44_000005 [Aphidius gifuensis]|uniref:chitinase n=1 Tax=Aphidius gifuensis TaxID=684658 RepID=A0A835CRG8_APHGI|nr:chitotriosidase-1-like [Aphidius gifuensis]KAF7990200.1 hypothetical protein HCN44_000005 [Aphidius gifuensis]